MLELQAQDALRHIAARYDVRVIKTMEWVLHGIFNRIYDGIAVDERGLQQAIEASRRAPVVFCPSHKSHIDYLVLSYVLWTHGVAPPHVAARPFRPPRGRPGGARPARCGCGSR